MIVPLKTPVKVVDALVVPASTTSTVQFSLPVPILNYALQVSAAEPINYPNQVSVSMTASLDQVDYHIPVNIGVNVSYSGAPSNSAEAASGILVQHAQLNATNTDTIDHTITVWFMGQ